MHGYIVNMKTVTEIACFYMKHISSPKILVLGLYLHICQLSQWNVIF